MLIFKINCGIVGFKKVVLTKKFVHNYCFKISFYFDALNLKVENFIYYY